MEESVGLIGSAGAIVSVVLTAVIIASLWKVFTKAGKPGWACLIPIYNLVVLLQIAGKPVWWIILLLIPLVNLVVGILIAISVAKNFGKGTGFAFGMLFLGFIFYPILGFGDAEYVGATEA